MTDDKLVISVEAQIKAFERSLARADAATAKMSRSVERRIAQLQKRIDSSFRLDGLSVVLGGLGLGAIGREITQYADAWTNAGNRLAAAGVPLDEVNGKLSELTAIANDARAPVEGVVTLYARLTAASGELGVSQQQLLRVTETVAKSLSASGASAAEVNSVVTQLAQGLASGTLQGDELRSLSENAPQLMQQLAKALGVPIGQLKELGREGKLTSKVVVDALLRSSAAIDKSFDATQSSIGAALTVLDNALTEFVGTAAKSSDAAAAIAGAIQLLAQNVPAAAGALSAFVATWLAIAGGTASVAAIRAAVPAMTALAASAHGTALAMFGLGTATTASGTAALGAAAAWRTFGAALAANPIGLAVLAATAVGTAIYSMSADLREGKAALEDFNDASTQAAQSGAHYAELTRIAAERDHAAAAKAVGEHEDSLWDLLDAQRAVARNAALNDAAEALRAKARLGLLGQIAAVREEAQDLGIDAQNQAEIANFDSFQDVNTELVGINAEIDAMEKGLARLGVPREVADDLQRIQIAMGAAVLAGDFTGAETLQEQAAAIINAAATISPETRTRLLAEFGDLFDLVGTLAANAGIDMPIGIDAGEATASLNILKTEAIELKDLLDGVSETELRLVSRETYQEAVALLADAKERHSDLRAEMEAALRGAGLGDAAVQEAIEIIDAFERGEISVAQADAALTAFGEKFDVSDVVAKIGELTAEAAELARFVESIAAATQAIETNTPTKDDDKPKRGSGGGRARTPFDDAQARVRREADETKALAAAQRELNATSADYVVQLEAARVEQELLNAAKEQGITITPPIANAIRELALESALATAEIEAVTEAQDSLRRATEEWRTSLKDASSGFVKDLVAGKSEAEALAGALQKVADKLVDIALNSAFDALFPSTGGSKSGGGFLSSLVKLLGFAEGGYTGDGGKYQPAGVVHKGEYVFSKAATKRIGVGNLEQLHRTGKSAGAARPRVTSEVLARLRKDVRGYATGGLVGGRAVPGYASGGYVTGGVHLRGYATGGFVGAPQMTPVVPPSAVREPRVVVGPTQVVVNNNTSAEVTTREQLIGNTKVIEIAVNEVKLEMARGGFDRTLGSRFGTTPRLVGR